MTETKGFSWRRRRKNIGGKEGREKRKIVIPTSYFYRFLSRFHHDSFPSRIINLGNNQNSMMMKKLRERITERLEKSRTKKKAEKLNLTMRETNDYK